MQKRATPSSGAQLLALLLVLCAGIAADPAPLPTPSPAAEADTCGDTNVLATVDRPTVGFSACAVKPHARLLELGYANEMAAGSAGDASNVTYPQTFFRVGVARNLEADVIGPLFAQTTQGAVTTYGYADSGVGLKYEVAHDGANAAAIDALMTVPTGSPAFTNAGPIETLNFDAGHSMGPLGLAATFGVSSQVGAALDGSVRRFTTTLPSAALTYQFANVYQLYAEIYASTRLRPDGGKRAGADAGVQFLAAPNVELDVEFGRTATDVTKTHYFGFGTAIKF